MSHRTTARPSALRDWRQRHAAALMLATRRLHASTRLAAALNPAYRLKCGLEIHTQLKTKYKLFSLSRTSFNARPNTKVSYFDLGLPGTQPKLNPEALYLALRLAAALNCDIQPHSSFDRKHYFYPDQPLGYQITQHYHPVAYGGSLVLHKELDGVTADKTIRFEQLQIEQDTGKTVFDPHDNVINVDLNRANIPLVELVTKPDFESLGQIKGFVKKYQTLVKTLGVCSGDLETGAIRVDVNVSINGGNRVEIKNLGSTGEIIDAVVFEYHRQIGSLEAAAPVQQQTRGWNGKETVLLRAKEDAVDYRYFPDPELPTINLSSSIKEELQHELPELPDQKLQRLMRKPYNLELKHARFLVGNEQIAQYYENLFSIVVEELQLPSKNANNWLFHDFLGSFNKLGMEPDVSLVPAEKLAHLIKKTKGELTTTSGKTVLLEIIKTPHKSIDNIIDEFGLAAPKDASNKDLEDAVEEICSDIIAANSDVVEKIKNGKANSINFLLGKAMKETRGKVSSDRFLEKFKQLLDI